jgi:hypothetical protein
MTNLNNQLGLILMKLKKMFQLKYKLDSDKVRIDLVFFATKLFTGVNNLAGPAFTKPPKNFVPNYVS